ncbi:MAG: nickel-responsive transcriptional regulator NikR [Elusimicrobiota bacterium]|nr:nickel-responsive transcriptional regulator NikR [Elusimicrobiota bacterium]MDH5662273.1 nickel-responsive transcriptional regulator NikR [Elusimicrobiota bacterium]
MTELVRFGVSLEKELLAKFDKHIKDKNYPTRSKAIGDLIRENLVKKEWKEGKEVVGAITLVYNHHRRELVNRLTDVEHDFHQLIVSSQHIHLDEDNCLEIVVVKGKPEEVEELAANLKSTKGVKHGSLTMATTGKEIA